MNAYEGSVEFFIEEGEDHGAKTSRFGRCCCPGKVVMSEIQELARMMKELKIRSSFLCDAVCVKVCPVYSQTGKEADVARGKLALVDGLMEAMFTDADGARERLQKCLLCGSCEANGPSGGELSQIFF